MFPVENLTLAQLVMEFSVLQKAITFIAVLHKTPPLTKQTPTYNLFPLA
jgi:hypothetical protein